MPFFRKKPVVIEAQQLTEDNANDILEWMQSYGNVGSYMFHGNMVVHTLEGDHEASIGHWIIRGVKNEFYPIKPDIFEMTYELEPLERRVC